MFEEINKSKENYLALSGTLFATKLEKRGREKVEIT